LNCSRAALKLRMDTTDIKKEKKNTGSHITDIKNVPETIE
jgi:hypothetical protein